MTKRRGRTGHLAYPFADTPTHTDNADLPERILVEPLGDKLACVLEREVEPRRPHVPVRHGRREVQQEDEVADDRAAYRRGWGEKSFVFEKTDVSQSVCALRYCAVGGRTYLRRRPRARSSATAPVRLPASSSCTVSHERVYVASQE